jgi:hypothetical protein
MTSCRVCAIVAALLLAACAEDAATEARVRELEQQARALANRDGCDRLDQCTAAPMGAKPCGGPWTYLVYCKATTDEAALLRVLDELRRVEEEYNQVAGSVSDCQFVGPPQVRLEGRTCTTGAP